MECYICLQDGLQEEQFMRCPANHHVCKDTCYPRVKRCPFCRCCVTTFTDHRGEQPEDLRYRHCENFMHGCRSIYLPSHRHECRWQLFSLISQEEDQMLRLLMELALTMQELPPIWTREQLDILERLEQLYDSRPELWETFAI